VPVGGDRHLQLGADPVGGGEQQGIAEARGLEVDGGGETAQRRAGARAAGRGCERLDGLDKCGAGIDIDTCGLVGAAVDGGLARLNSAPRPGVPGHGRRT